MSSEIGLNDVKPGMWVEFDDADGHYAGELHEMKNPESMVDVLIMSMGHKPPLYGTIAPAFPCQSQSRSQFFKTSVRDDRFPFTKVEASFE